MARRHRGRASDLKRRTGTRPERRTFVILCEGTVTEPDYLEALKRLPEVREVASVEIRGSAGVPLKLVEAAIEVKRENNAIDEVWCVFDVEAPQTHPNLNEARARARDNEIKTAVSNPCFEIWLVLHFKTRSAWLTTDEAVKLRREQDLTTGKEVANGVYMQHRKTAALRAREPSKRHTDNGTSFPDDNPSSGMFRLLEAIEPNKTK